MTTHILEQILEQCAAIRTTEERREFFVKPCGDGRYVVTEQGFVRTPPKVYSFASDIGDVIVIWAVNPFLDESTAHEIAVQIGEKIGWYV